MRKPRVFIGSSAERRVLAAAIQENLERDVIATVWNQDQFGPSEYPLDVLERAADESDAGVFVLAPDDVTIARGAKRPTVRDNVLFELGLFIGAMGRRRCFLVVPRNARLHLPTDLAGLGTVDYDGRRRDRNWVAALGSACSKIVRALHKLKAVQSSDLPVERLTWFGDATPVFDSLIPRARKITTFFIHSRRWRENHNHLLKVFLKRRSSRLHVYLPDPKDLVLMSTFRRNFDDGVSIPSFIEDACRYFVQLKRSHPAQVSIRFAQHYPTYSFYLLDKTAIIAMYPTTDRRRPVPTLQVGLRSPIGEFVLEDLGRLSRTARRMTKQETARFTHKGASK